jgi:hypothetical protein
MKSRKKLWFVLSMSIVSVALLLPAAEVFAWGSSSYSSRSYSDYGGDGSSDSSYDSYGGSLTEDDCRNCHEDLNRFPQLEDTNPDKHHILVGLLIPSWTKAPYGNPGEIYECLSCHAVNQTDNSVFEITVTRDCLECHPSRTVTGYRDNVHHDTPTARRDCGACHGWNSSGYGR